MTAVDTDDPTRFGTLLQAVAEQGGLTPAELYDAGGALRGRSCRQPPFRSSTERRRNPDAGTYVLVRWGYPYPKLACRHDLPAKLGLIAL